MSKVILSALMALIPVQSDWIHGPIKQKGVASYYGRGNWHGEITANGERFDPEAKTCAHRDLPFGTIVQVRRLDRDVSTTCRINDRGPFKLQVDSQGQLKPEIDLESDYDRVIDLSVGTARDLGMIEEGTVHIQIRHWLPPKQ